MYTSDRTHCRLNLLASTMSCSMYPSCTCTCTGAVHTIRVCLQIFSLPLICLYTCTLLHTVVIVHITHCHVPVYSTTKFIQLMCMHYYIIITLKSAYLPLIKISDPAHKGRQSKCLQLCSPDFFEWNLPWHGQV